MPTNQLLVMKKIFTTALFSTLVIYSFAQITITRVDFGTIGDRLFYATDSLISDSEQVIGKRTGANIVWDLSTYLKPNVYDTADFVQPSTLPNAPEEANLAIVEGGEPGFFFIDNNGVKIVIPGSEFLGGNSTMLSVTKFPFTYGGMPTRDSVTSRIQGTPADFGEESLPFDSIRVTVKIVSISTVDGWGSLILPSGSQNALRVKNDTKTDIKLEGKLPFIGTWINIPFNTGNAGNQTVIAWYGKGKDYTLAQLELDTNGNVQSIRYQVPVTYPNSLAENKSNNTFKINASPNPSSQTAFIEFESVANAAGSISVFDITGKSVYKKEISATAGKNNIEVPVSLLQNGMYFATINIGNSKATVKLMVGN